MDTSLRMKTTARQADEIRGQAHQRLATNNTDLHGHRKPGSQSALIRVSSAQIRGCFSSARADLTFARFWRRRKGVRASGQSLLLTLVKRAESSSHFPFSIVALSKLASWVSWSVAGVPNAL